MFGHRPRRCPFGHDVGPGHAKVSWAPCGCGPALEANERGRGLGHITVTCTRPASAAPLRGPNGDGLALAAAPMQATAANSAYCQKSADAVIPVTGAAQLRRPSRCVAAL